MKSERRHELQHNALADWLVKSFEAVKPHQSAILTGVTILLVALAAYLWWNKATGEQSLQAWTDLNNGMMQGNLGGLLKAREDYPGSAVAQTATVVIADNRLAGGCFQLFHDEAMARQELGKAIELYGSDMGQCQMSLLLERAAFGLAKAKESKGDLESADQHYRELLRRWPNGAYAAAARERLDDIQRPEIKKLYDDLKQFNPKPVVSEQEGIPTEKPKAEPAEPKKEPAAPKK